MGPSLDVLPSPDPGGYSYCEVIEDDLGLNVVFLGSANPCVTGFLFDRRPRTIALTYEPTYWGGEPRFSAVYELRETGPTTYRAYFAQVNMVGGETATHNIGITPTESLAGIRIRSFVGACLEEDPLYCLNQGILGLREVHDELHICIDNASNEDVSPAPCVSGYGGDAWTPRADWILTVLESSIPDVTILELDSSPSTGVAPMATIWDIRTLWYPTCAAEWATVSTAPTLTAGATLWARTEIRLRVVDANGNGDAITSAFGASWWCQ